MTESTGKLTWGRKISADEIRSGAAVTVIDEAIARKAFGSTTFDNGKAPVIFINKVALQVVGLAEAQEWQGNLCWMPALTLQTHFGAPRRFSTIRVYPQADLDPKSLHKAVVSMMEIRHGKKDFRIYPSTDSNIADFNQFMTVLTLALAGIGAISMLVGGIGVMNIMLVSVSERTREIGIRMAVGATERDIGRQFLLESVVLCGLAGAIATLLTYGVVKIAAAIVATKTDMLVIHMSGDVVLEALVAAMVVGLVFGYLPARQAARLNPVEALARP